MVKLNVFIYTMEYYSTLKRNFHPCCNTEFKNTVLSETHQSQKDKYCMSIITEGT